jgi:Bacterial regulatory proteins, luxR family
VHKAVGHCPQSWVGTSGATRSPNFRMLFGVTACWDDDWLRPSIDGHGVVVLFVRVLPETWLLRVVLLGQRPDPLRTARWGRRTARFVTRPGWPELPHSRAALGAAPSWCPSKCVAARSQLQQLQSARRCISPPEPRLGALTRRERQVAALAAGGYTAAQIATQLHIGVRTVPPRPHLPKTRDHLQTTTRAPRRRARIHTGSVVSTDSGDTDTPLPDRAWSP